MVEYPHVLEQPELVQTFITLVTVVTIEKEVAMLDVLFSATGVKHQPVRMVSNVYTVLSKVLNIIIFFPKFSMLHFLS